MDSVPPSQSPTDDGDRQIEIDSYDDLLREGMIYAEQGFYLKAIELFQFAIENGEADAMLYLHIARCYLEMDDNDEAKTFLKKAYKVDNQCYDVVYLLGFVYFLEAIYEKAIKYFDQAIEIQSESRDAYYYKAIALMRDAEIEDAVQCFDFILTKYPTDHFVLYQKGLLCLQSNDKEQAMTLFKQAKDLGNQDAEEMMKTL